MPDPIEIQCNPLTTAERPLLNKFYKSCGSPMRTSDGAEAWVARAGEIIGGLNLTAVPGGHWLTGLLVAPAHRRQGVAQRLIKQACGNSRTWLFCHPELQGFYERLGFVIDEDMPPVLVERLARYRRGKPLLAMARGQSSLAGSRPGNSTSV